MSNMMQLFVNQELENQMKEKYPHIQYPPCMYARVVSIAEELSQYKCTLKILDKNKNPDNRFPEVPNVITDKNIIEGEIVVILLLYGDCSPYIIGRCL